MPVRCLLLLLQLQRVFPQCSVLGGGAECDRIPDQVRASELGPHLLQKGFQLQLENARSLLAARGREGPVPLTFKHFAKAGGTFVQAVLEKVIPGDLLEVKNETQSLTAGNTEGRFVIGGIRNPCEYYPSLWSHMMSERCLWGQGCYMTAFPPEERARLMPSHKEPPFDSAEDLSRFRAFLQNTSSSSPPGHINLMSLRFWSAYARLRGEEGQHQHGAERSTAHWYLDVEMGPEERQGVLDTLSAFDPGRSVVSCWMKVESLNEDLRRCLKLYDQQGGKVLWDRLDQAMGSSTHYTSPHSACSVYYDADTRAAVRRGDAVIFEKFGYSSCCEEDEAGEGGGLSEPQPRNQSQSLRVPQAQVPPAKLAQVSQVPLQQTPMQPLMLQSPSPAAAFPWPVTSPLTAPLAPSAPSTPLASSGPVPGAGRLTLVTGTSGSGVGLLARVLCHAADSLCVPGASGWSLSQLAPDSRQVYLDIGLSRPWLRTRDWNWTLFPLEATTAGSPRSEAERLLEELPLPPSLAQAKAELRSRGAQPALGSPADLGLATARQIALFNRGLWLLWQDAEGRPYIEQGRDQRDPKLRSRLLDSLAAVAQQWLLTAQAAGHPSQHLVLERSMPFKDDGSRSHSPFLEDLKDLAARIGPAWSADVNLVLRDPPRAWHTSEDERDSAPFLARVEQLAAKAAAGEGAAIGVPISVLAYNTLACDPAQAMVQLGLTGAAADALRSSPELSHSSRIAMGVQHTNVDYLKGLVRRERLWESGLYPNLDELLEGSRACCGRNRLWYVLPFLVVLACLLAFLISWSGPAWLQLQLQVLSWYDVFFVHLQYSAGIPMAYDLSVTLQRDKAYSGFLIGSFWGCVGVGSILLARPFVSRASQATQRLWALGCIAVLVACSFLYSVAADPPSSWDISADQQAAILVVMRMTCGFAWSISTMVLSCMAVRVTPKREQVGNEVARSLFTTLGMGCGPLLNVLPTPRGDTNFTGEAAAQPLFITGIIGVGFLLVAWMVIPTDAEQLDIARGDKETARVSTESPVPKLHRYQIMVFTCGATLGVVRAWLSAALEAAASLVLETDFGWATGRVGLVTGIVLILAAGIIVLFLMLRTRLGDPLLLILGCGTSFVTASSLALLVHFVESPWIFVLADLLVFPSAFVASSVAEGLVMSHTVPGTICSVENAWLIRNALKCNLGRFVGPLTARASLAAGGQSLCAAVQAFLAVAICVLAGCQLAALVPEKDRRCGYMEQILLDKAKDKGIGKDDGEKAPGEVHEKRRRVRLAICGLGRVADFYLENIATSLSHRIELVAGADPKAAARAKLPPGVAAEENMAGLLRHRPDAVVVCVPTPLHTEVTSQVLDANLPVLLEKPAVTCMQELEGLYAKSKRPLHVALHGQHADEVLWMAENLHTFGRLVDVEAKFFDDYIKGNEVSETMVNLASSWLDSGVNALACLFAALGQSVLLTSLQEEQMVLAGHNFNVAATAEIEVGAASGRILTDWRLGRSEKTITLRFEKSTVVLQMVKRLVLVDGEVVRDFSSGPARMVGRYARVLNEFLEVLESGTSNRKAATEIHWQLLHKITQIPGQGGKLQ